MSDVQSTVFAIIAKEISIDVATIHLESTLKDLKIDSFDAVQIVFEIEDHYQITLPDRDPRFDTASVGGLVRAVEVILAQPAAGAAKTR